MAASRKSRGRPENTSRTAALVTGAMTYEGRACKRCGGTERYTKGCACVHCLRAFAIESRQALKALQLNSGDNDLDFLGAPAHPGSPRHTSTCDSEDLDFLDTSSGFSEPLTVTHKTDQEKNKNKSGRERPENSVLRRARVTPKPKTDPEPLCPQCGCGVEADHESIGGWLRRTSPWRCTICEWEDDKPPPDVESLDSLDFLS